MIEIPELVFLAFAGYRLTQLGVHDTILDPARARVDAWMAANPTRPRLFVADLISCVYCLGWWLSGAVLATYLLVTGRVTHAPLLIHGIEWLAVAGGAVLLNRLDDSLKDRE
ncbi:DUF1360 domain-containing protein [Streptomyces sp. CA-253872]|uniref:DUF1360 domain-containing protein n=1 Tax=Streptomyces sp. CA-253872 TaxID=3240067 RepID=UPI003D929B9E